MSSKLIIINAKKELGGCKTYEYRKYGNVDGTITYIDCEGVQKTVGTSSNEPMQVGASLVGYFCAKEILSFNYRQELGSRPVQPVIIDENGCNIPSTDDDDGIVTSPETFEFTIYNDEMEYCGRYTQRIDFVGNYDGEIHIEGRTFGNGAYGISVEGGAVLNNGFDSTLLGSAGHNINKSGRIPFKVNGNGSIVITKTVGEGYVKNNQTYMGMCYQGDHSPEDEEMYNFYTNTANVKLSIPEKQFEVISNRIGEVVIEKSLDDNDTGFRP